MVTFLGSLVQSCCEEGGTLQTNITGCVGSALSVSAPPVCPHSQRGYFHGLHCSGSRLLCRELSEAGPGLHTPPWSKPLSFRYSGTPQRRRLDLACVVRPPRVRAAQVARCLASAVSATHHLPCSCCSVFWVYNRRTFSGRCCPSRTPTSLG